MRTTAGGKDIPTLVGNGLEVLGLNAASDGARRFLQLAGSFGTDLSAFARHLRRNASATVYDERAEAVSLMTIHGAKGLEFDTVFIAGLEEGILPHNFGGRHCDLEEERRLLYVAITRAQRQLLLSGCRQRQLHGRTVQLAPSRFLAELPQRDLLHSHPAVRTKKTTARQLSLF